MRAVVAGAIAAAVLGVPARGRADPVTPATKEACVEAYKSSQELSRAGALSRAREKLLVCGRDPCPAVLQRDCVPWLSDVEERMPTIVPALRDGKGRDVPDARVLVDGAVVASRVDGRPIELDPGEHVVRLEPRGARPLEQRVVAREREKGRELTFLLVSPDGARRESRAAPGSRALPWTFWAASGVAVLGLGSFGVFGARGLSQRGDLLACHPDCPEDQIDKARTSFLVADISLGVGLVAAALATWIFVARPGGAPPASAALNLP